MSSQVSIVVLVLTAPPKFLRGRYIMEASLPIILDGQWMEMERSEQCVRLGKRVNFGILVLRKCYAEWQREPLSFLPLSQSLICDRMKSSEWVAITIPRDAVHWTRSSQPDVELRVGSLAKNRRPHEATKEERGQQHRSDTPHKSSGGISKIEIFLNSGTELVISKVVRPHKLLWTHTPSKANFRNFNFKDHLCSSEEFSASENGDRSITLFPFFSLRDIINRLERSNCAEGRKEQLT